MNGNIISRSIAVKNKSTPLNPLIPVLQPINYYSFYLDMI